MSTTAYRITAAVHSLPLLAFLAVTPATQQRWRVSPFAEVESEWIR